MIPIMLNGLPGNVAKILATAAVKDSRFTLVPFSLTGEDIEDPAVRIEDIEVALLKPSQRALEIPGILNRYPGLIAVDFTHPTAVNENARFYVQNKIPFVMGTTGGDRQALEKTVSGSDVPAVISPNMAKQIVGFQAMMEYAATTFPGLFKGYALEVVESHQQGKADTSGTARALVSCFNRLGADFDEADIQMVRDPKIQEEEWGIPKAYLSGHGWHTYTLKSPDGSSLFQFKHNINGRDIYAAGTFDAIMFLKKKAKAFKGKTLFTMIDVMTGSD